MVDVAPAGDTDRKTVFAHFSELINRDASRDQYLEVILYTLGFVIVAYHLYYGLTRPVIELTHANVHLGLFLVVFYLVQYHKKGEAERSALDTLVTVVILTLVIASTVYVHFNIERWLFEARPRLTFTRTDLLVGATLIAVTIHATWRAYGAAISLAIVASLVYAWAGPYFPGLLRHSGMDLERIVFYSTISIDGVYSFILLTGATWVAIFVLFAGIVEGYGGLTYIINIGKYVGGRMKSGVLQMAVIASMIVGSIMGASVANVATTGSFTIPLMKDEGVDADFAAGIESMASTGGQILPPVMGTAAFLMADILGISYFEVVRGALLPALLFYGALFIAILVASVQFDWSNSRSPTTKSTSSAETETGDTPEPTTEEPSPELSVDSRTETEPNARTSGWSVDWGNVLHNHLIHGLPFFLSFIVLLYTLVYLRYDPLTAGTYSILAAVPAALAREILTDGLTEEAFSAWISDTLYGCKRAVENMAPLTAVLASIGVLVTLLGQTGFTQKFAFQLVTLGAGELVLVLLLAMSASLLFGLGMPTAPAYVVVAILSAPALEQLGVNPLVAHMFVFYYALLSTITPPVALSCALAAGIAGSKFLDTCFKTLRLGLYAFVIPFAFVFNPEIIMWDGTDTVSAFVVLLIAFMSFSIGTLGYNLNAKIPNWQRGVYIGMSLLIIFVPIRSVQIGLAGVLLLAVVGENFAVKRGISIRSYMQ